MNPFQQLLRNRASRTPCGTWVMSASPIVAEAIGNTGFDWAVLDMEHTPLDLMDLVHLLQAVGNTPMAPLVRVPWNDTVNVKRVLDAGAASLLFPFIQNADEARQAVAATRYPPEGVRGMAGMSRASRFGTKPDFFKNANAEVCAVLQLETPAAIAQLENIAAVPGVGGLFVGPGDLGMPIGTVCGTPEVVAQYRAIGYDFVAVASDLGLLMRAAQSAAQALRAIDNPAAAAAPALKPQSGY